MIPYYVLVFVPCIVSLSRIPGGNAEIKRKRVIESFFVLLFILLTLRAESVGRDLGSYKIVFSRINDLGWKQIGDFFSEPAWFVLNKAIGQCTDNFQWFLVITALITILPMVYVYEKETLYPVLTISLFITMPTFIMLFSGLRQSVAIALGLIAYEYTKQRRRFQHTQLWHLENERRVLFLAFAR